MEFLSLIVSFSALGFAVFTFSIHGRKIHKLRKKLDEYRLSFGTRELLVMQKAYLVAHRSTTNDPYKIQLSIRNDGMAIAKNISFKFIHPQTGQDISDTFSITMLPSPEIKPKELIVLNISYKKETPKICQLILYWDDEYQVKNSRKQLLELM